MAPAATAAGVAAATAASYGLGWLVAIPVLIPLLNTLPAFLALAYWLQRSRVRTAVAVMLVWAATLGTCATTLSYFQPDAAGRLFINGDRYRAEMFDWVLTGRGAESDPARFVPQHLTHAAIFSGLALATGSACAMPMGAVLMNYMGHYVGALGASSRAPAATLLLAWHPWSIVRIASFVVLGVILAGPVLSRARGFDYRWSDSRHLLFWAVGGLVVDMILKAVLAPRWRELLLAVVGW